MKIYRGVVDLLDYVFYATVERGKVYETGSFIHNYALAYALGLVQGKTYTYAQTVQEPHYAEELTPLNEHLYITPASSKRISHRLVQWNTLREGYAYPGKPPSLGYPDWGFARMLRPGCQFVFYMMVVNTVSMPVSPALQGLLDGNSVCVRLGKFPAKARLTLQPAENIEQQHGPFKSNALLNWRDLEADPQVCDVVTASLPTRLLANVGFDNALHYDARFGEEVVQLPAQMRFLARPPETKRKKKG